MSKPHAPAVSGPQINIPEGSRGGVNESTPMDQRVPDRITEVSTGPKLLEVEGSAVSYLPARYEVTQTIEGRDGKPIEFKFIREDR